MQGWEQEMNQSIPAREDMYDKREPVGVIQIAQVPIHEVKSNL